MKWTDTAFKGDQKADVQLGEVVNVFLNDVQKADAAVGNIRRQAAPGPMPAPRMPGDDRRQHE